MTLCVFLGIVQSVNLKENGHVNLESQVCSLDYAKRLKELGVKQESLVYWLNIQDRVHMKVDKSGQPIIDRIDYRIELGSPLGWNIDKDNRWSAFTVAELGEILPKGIHNPDKIWKEIYLRCEPANRLGFWLVSYGHDIWTEENTEADARAKCLIMLLENNLIKIQDINNET